MSSVVISGDTSGTVSLTVPAVAGTNTVTLPAATGTVMVSGNMPAFSANLSTGQSISSGVDTVILFNVKDFDTATAYSTATGRFTPQVAGYYQINANIILAGSAINLMSAAFRKNGVVSAFVGTSAFAFNSSPYRFSGSQLFYLNGSTDYIDITAYISAGASPSVSTKSAFSGILIRTA